MLVLLEPLTAGPAHFWRRSVEEHDNGHNGAKH
jgi:hypothetical protein